MQLITFCANLACACIISHMVLSRRHAGKWRLGLAVLLGVTLAYGVLLLCVQVNESVARSRSEAMFEEFLRLRPGETTEAEIAALRARLKNSFAQDVNCAGSGCVYTVGSVWGYSRWYAVTQFAHDHLPSSQLTLRTTGDVLSSATFSVGVFVPKGYGTREERARLSDANYVAYSSAAYYLFGRASLETARPDPCCDAQLASEPDHRIWGPSGCTNCLAIWVSATPNLQPSRRADLFQINFDCMTQWSVCTDKEDIMPKAAREKKMQDALEERSAVPPR
jgi:hypothetical protein